MKTEPSSRVTSRADAEARAAGEAQRVAAEKGKSVGFYAKEIAKKALKHSAHFEKSKRRSA